MSLIINISIAKVTYNDPNIAIDCKLKKSIFLKYFPLQNLSDNTMRIVFNSEDENCFKYKYMKMNLEQTNVYNSAIKFIDTELKKLIKCYNDIFWETIFEFLFCLQNLISGDFNMTNCLNKHKVIYELKQEKCNDTSNYIMCLNLDEKQPTLKYFTHNNDFDTNVLCSENTNVNSDFF